jgi:hypothetical protein
MVNVWLHEKVIQRLFVAMKKNEKVILRPLVAMKKRRLIKNVCFD